MALNIGIGTYIAIQLGEFFVFFSFDPSSYISVLDFTDELKELCHLFSHNGLRVNHYFYEWPNITNTTITNNLYRIIQELLKNAVKHSKAENVYLQFMGNPKQTLSIIYEDDGIGFKPDEHTNNGLGLKNIENRIALLKGSIRFDSSDATKGTIIFIDIEM